MVVAVACRGRAPHLAEVGLDGLHLGVVEGVRLELLEQLLARLERAAVVRRCRGAEVPWWGGAVGSEPWRVRREERVRGSGEWGG